MAIKFESINKTHKEFIEKQKVFVIGSAGADGFINVSQKGMDSFKSIDENTVLWMNHTGSGNETSAHVQENGRITIMFNSFDKAPMILKLYGEAMVIHEKDDSWEEMSSHFSEYIGERNSLQKWAEKKGREGMKLYWSEKNVETIDGVKTNIMEKSL